MVDDWYITAYEPILDVQEKIVGMLYVGIMESKYALMKERLILLFFPFSMSGMLIALIVSFFEHMPDGCPPDGPINIFDPGLIDLPGCAEMFFHSFLCFKNYLIGDEGIDNKACYRAYKTSKGQKIRARWVLLEIFIAHKLSEKTKI